MNSAGPKRFVESHQTALVCLLLGLITLTVFWPAARHGFAGYDDPAYVSENPHVQGGLNWPAVVWAFTTGHASNWHPLTWLSHMLDRQLFGPNAGPQHLVSLGFHVANTLLLFLLLRRLTGGLWRSALVAALFALHPLHVESVVWIAERKDVLSGFFFLLTLLAYVNYVQARGGGPFPRTPEERERAETRRPKVEGRKKSEGRSPKAEGGCLEQSGIQGPTSNVQGPDLTQRRREPQRVAEGSSALRSSAFLCVSALRMGPACLWYWVAVAMFACGLMSKPMLVTLPFVLLLLDFWPLKRSAQCGVRSAESGKGPGKLIPSARKFHPSSFILHPLLLEKLPFMALSGASCVITVIMQRRGGAVSTNLAFGWRVANALVSCVRYLRKAFWPTNLSVLYPHPGKWPAWQVAACALLLLAITAAVIRLARSRPCLAVGWLWFCGMLVPTIGLVQVGIQSMADRYTYLPLIGLLIMVVWGADDLAAIIRRNALQRDCDRTARSVWSAWSLLPLWGRPAPCDSASKLDALQTLRAAVHPQPPSQLANQLDGAGAERSFSLRSSAFLCVSALAALALVTCAGLTRRQIGYWRDTETLWRHALAVTQRNPVAEHNLGIALASRGAWDEAIRHFAAAVRLRPELEGVHRSLADALVKQRRFAEAIQQDEESLRLNPSDAAAHNNLGNLLTRVGRVEAAIPHYTAALRLDANDAGAHYNLGLALASRGSFGEAAAQFQEVLRLKPDAANARQRLDQALAAQAKCEQAIEQARQALRSRPGDAGAHSSLGRALVQAGQFEAGIGQYTEAARLDPRNAQIPYQLGLALVRKGDWEQATGQFGSALELDPNFAAAHYALGRVALLQRRGAEALEHWQAAARLNPHWADPLISSAWVLATDPQPELRDGPEAVRLASRAAALAGAGNVRILDTLAAAYAEAGRFAEASGAAREAESAAVAQGQPDLAEQIQQRLALYDARQPYREEPGAR